MNELINGEDMATIYEETDSLGIDREMIRVELTKEDPGSVSKGAGDLLSSDSRDIIEIVLPLTVSVHEWRPILKSRLLATMGED